MNISVVVITRNRHELLIQVLSSLVAQTVAPFEVVIVDGSDAPYKVPKELDAKLPIRLFRDRKKLIPHARNIGIQKSSGDIIFFVDDDCTLHTEAIGRVVNHFRRFPATQAVVGMIRNGTPQNVYARVQHFYYERWIRSFGLSGQRIQRLPDGCLMDFELLAAKRSLLRRYDFNTDVPFGRDEDVELGVRIYKDTKELYFNPTIKADHVPRQTLASLIQRNFMVGYCNAYLFQTRNILTKPRFRVHSASSISFLSGTSMSWHVKVVYVLLLGIYPIFSRIGRLTFFSRERLLKSFSMQK